MREISCQAEQFGFFHAAMGTPERGRHQNFDSYREDTRDWVKGHQTPYSGGAPVGWNDEPSGGRHEVIARGKHELDERNQEQIPVTDIRRRPYPSHSTRPPYVEGRVAGNPHRSECIGGECDCEECSSGNLHDFGLDEIEKTVQKHLDMDLDLLSHDDDDEDDDDYSEIVHFSRVGARPASPKPLPHDPFSPNPYYNPKTKAPPSRFFGEDYDKDESPQPQTTPMSRQLTSMLSGREIPSGTLFYR